MPRLENLQKFKIVKSLKEVNPLVKCNTCGDIVKDPMYTCKKDEIHCKSCVFDMTCCPTCEGDPHLHEALFVNDLLNDMEVYCCNTHLGCKWIGLRKHAMNHLDNECSFFICSGNSNGCDWIGMNKDVDNHEEHCGLICISCPHQCSLKILRKNLLSHEKYCRVLINARNKEKKIHFEERKKKYQEQSKRFEDERNRAQDNFKKKFIQKVKPNNNDIISLNFRGQIIHLSKSTLLNERSSPYFESILNDKSNFNDNQYFIDRNPKLFLLIILILNQILLNIYQVKKFLFYF